MIPKKLHYIWFGGTEHSPEMAAFIAGWKALMPDHEVIEWNEHNLNIKGHPWLERMHHEKKWAFASDYARLLVLYEQGGIYLDTDVEMKKSLEPFRKDRCFFSFEFDHFLSTAIFGSEPGHPLIAALMDEYDHMVDPIVNNTIVTRHFFRRYNEFRLGNGEQLLAEGVHIYPKEFLVVPSVWKKKNFSVHHADNRWNEERSTAGRGGLVRSVVGDVFFYKLVNLKMGLSTTFWAEERSRRKK